MNLEQIKERITNLKIVKMIQAAMKTWQEVNVALLAAALAYHTIFSIAPLLIIAIYVAGLLLGRADAQEYIAGEIRILLGKNVSESILSMIDSFRRSDSGLIASIIGLLTLIFGATRVFNQLESSLDIIFETSAEDRNGIKSMLQKRALSFLMMLGFSILLLLSVLISAGISLINNAVNNILPQTEVIFQLLDYIVPVLLGVIMFSAIFRYLPNKDMGWRNILVGGLLTSVLFAIGQQLISFYLGTSTIGSAYGAAGTLLVILVWIYYSALIFYFGAVFTKAYSNREKLTEERV
jgi:membrane protein